MNKMKDDDDGRIIQKVRYWKILLKMKMMMKIRTKYGH